MSTSVPEQPIGWVRFYKPKDDWYYLAPQAREAYMDGLATAVERAEARGARLLGSYRCRGQSRWARFEVWEFSDVQALIDFTQALEEIRHFQYFAEDHTVGRRYLQALDADSWAI
jgi:hypothetical protein